ncbi:hypothetical protein LUZ60_004238 [Juncus effusus]|nr:hypothetical protein LUZ60_004238 [Juncus effusus]
MGGVCSTGSPLDRTPSELSFRAIQFIENDLKPFQPSSKKHSRKRNVAPIEEIIETTNESSQCENKPNVSPPKEISKSKVVKSKEGSNANPTLTKTSNVSIVDRVSNAGFGKAVEGIDLLISGMTNLNPSNGFISPISQKGNLISILAFEVANTIVKGANLMHSLSKENVKYLKENVFSSNGVQILVSTDSNELLRITAADKRQELNVFAKEIIRFGNRCKDPQWHNLDRYFSKLELEVTPQKQLKEMARADMQYLLNLVKNTAELYHEMHALDKFELEFKQRLKEENSIIEYQRGDTVQIIKQELKSQRKHVKRLQRKSLWSKVLEDIIEKLVDIIHFLHLEINIVFNAPDAITNRSTDNRQRLGSAGLSLHYANVITLIDNIYCRSSSINSSTRDTLYKGLPPSIKSQLRNRLHLPPLAQEVPVPVLKTSIENTLQWLVPIANNTTRAHHGFGWVGEWAHTGGMINRRQNGPVQTEVAKIETLFHADKKKTEAYILDLVIWLHYLISQTRSLNGGNKSPTKSPVRSPPKVQRPSFTLNPKNAASSSSSNSSSNSNFNGDLETDLNLKQINKVKSKSLEFERNGDDLKLKRNDRLSRSNGNWTPPVGNYEMERIRVLDVMDRVEFGGAKI